jgi:hypothetical protein
MTRIYYEMALVRQAELRRQVAGRRAEHSADAEVLRRHPSRRWNPLARPISLLRLVSQN